MIRRRRKGEGETTVYERYDEDNHKSHKRKYALRRTYRPEEKLLFYTSLDTYLLGYDTVSMLLQIKIYRF